MKLTFQVGRFFTILFSLSILWLVFYLSVQFIKPKENSNISYIPKESDFVLTLDGNKFIEDVIYGLLIESKDSQSLQELRTFWNEELKTKKQFKDKGIDFNSDVVLYGKTVHDGIILYTLFNLTDSEKFKKEIEANLGYFQALQCNKKVGVIVSYIGESDYMNVQELANEALVKSNTFKKNLNQTSLLHFTSKNLKLGAYQIQTKGGLNTNISQSKIELDGKFIFTSKDKPSLNQWSLKKDNLHFHSVLLEQKHQNSLAAIFEKIGISFPGIEEISLNYKNMRLLEAQSGLVLSPQIDLLLHFSTDFNLEKVFSNKEKLASLGYTIDGNKLIIGNTFLHIDSLDNRTLFIGTTKENVLAKASDNLLCLKGNLVNLTNLEGGGFILAMVAMYPPFKSTRGFFQAIKHTDISIKSSEKGTFTLKGNIEFKEKRQPILEITKLAIGLQ